MKNRRLRNYLQQKAEKKAGLKPADTKSNPDKHTNQDFNGYPNAPAKEEIIDPKTKQEKKVAAVDSKDGEKIINPQEKKKTKLACGVWFILPGCFCLLCFTSSRSPYGYSDKLSIRK